MTLIHTALRAAGMRRRLVLALVLAGLTGSARAEATAVPWPLQLWLNQVGAVMALPWLLPQQVLMPVPYPYAPQAVWWPQANAYPALPLWAQPPALPALPDSPAWPGQAPWAGMPLEPWMLPALGLFPGPAGATESPTWPPPLPPVPFQAGEDAATPAAPVTADEPPTLPVLPPPAPAEPPPARHDAPGAASHPAVQALPSPVQTAMPAPPTVPALPQSDLAVDLAAAAPASGVPVRKPRVRAARPSVPASPAAGQRAKAAAKQDAVAAAKPRRLCWNNGVVDACPK
jgi:hypothetical protein